jgi:hypothetical protein
MMLPVDGDKNVDFTDTQLEEEAHSNLNRFSKYRFDTLCASSVLPTFYSLAKVKSDPQLVYSLTYIRPFA